ncbi:hypothetical protein L2E82_13883 [Cichorium intybus]|uniref:Uncharacterized protein n=1 Tax=Cichorium intybus TaxID=13427 RepID=A0ACB9EYW8_CICIN|nr:hypothetical protein L2E82_13883 [Cichorium intybus]
MASEDDGFELVVRPMCGDGGMRLLSMCNLLLLVMEKNVYKREGPIFCNFSLASLGGRDCSLLMEDKSSTKGMELQVMKRIQRERNTEKSTSDRG